MPDFPAALDVTLRTALRWEGLRPAVEAGAAAVAADPRVAGARRVILAGSGDSWYAARALLPLWRRRTGLPVLALRAAEAARYEAPLMGPGDALVAVSASGSSARVREAVALARARGAVAVGVTGVADGPLARGADLALLRPVGHPELPGEVAKAFFYMAEWSATLLALAALAGAIGTARGALAPGAGARDLDALAAATLAGPEVAGGLDAAAAAAARALEGLPAVRVLGSGPSLGTALYAAAKFTEQAPVDGIAQDLEEWAHIDVLAAQRRGPAHAAFVLAPPGNALDRAREVAAAILEAGARAFVVTEAGSFPAGATVFGLPPVGEEWLSPALYHLPCQLAAFHLGDRAGAYPMPPPRADGGRWVRGGVVREDPAGLG